MTTETTELTGAALLREAARVMRERAEAATPGPWQTYGTLLGPRSERYPDMVRPYVANTFEAERDEALPNAEHLASWHPAVALTVADLLEDTAGHIEYTGDESGDDIRHAFIVARAYLGLA